MEISPERGVILDRYIAKMNVLSDMRVVAYARNGLYQNSLSQQEVIVAEFKRQNNITTAELIAWKGRNRAVATSVKHAVELLGAAQ